MRNKPTRPTVLEKPRAMHARGFTLLEMVFVLSLIVIIVTWVTVSVSTVDTEKRLRQASDKVESLTRRARAVAIKQQRPYQITITEEGVSMAPKFARPEGNDDEPLTDEDGQPLVSRHPDVTATEETDPEVTYEIRRWMSDEWVAIKGDQKVVITLDAVGLCEPISIRCTYGESWMIHQLHPLTAMVRDEELNVKQ